MSDDRFIASKPAEGVTDELRAGITSGTVSGTFRDLINLMSDIGMPSAAAELEADLRSVGMTAAAIDNMKVTFEPDGTIQLLGAEPAHTPCIYDAINWSNGMTTVFDQFGNQMCEYQGCTDDVMPRIRAAGFGHQPRALDWSRASGGAVD